MSADTLAEIASAVGGKVIGRSVRVVWPGKDTRKTGGVAISLASNRCGFIVNSFYNDVTASDAFDFVRSRLRRPGIEASAPDKFIKGIKGDQDKARAERIARAMDLWDEGVDPRGTLAEHYLNERRKLTIPAEAAGYVLRWIARINALVGLFRDIETDEPTGITRVYLRPDGSMIDRRFEGVIGGAGVKLNPPKDGLLCVAEGLETAMAAQELGIGPTWALGSSNAVATFPVLPNVSTLIIFEEKDEASSASVGECARRWHRGGCDVAFAKPNGKGDLNDTLIFNGKFTIKPFKVYHNV